MARYSLNLPVQLKQDAERFATQQEVSLNQFILWAVSEKVGELSLQVDGIEFPRIIFRTGASGIPQPTLRSSGLRVQTIVLARNHWRMTVEEIADEYNLSSAQVTEALDFYAANRGWVDACIANEKSLEPK